MHPNIAQISRWWIAKSIINQKIDLCTISCLFHHTSSKNIQSWNQPTIPYDLAPLVTPTAHPSNQDCQNVPTWLPNTGKRSQKKVDTNKVHFQQTVLQPVPQSNNNSQSTTTNHHTNITQQTLITQWMEHRPFITGIPSNSLDEKHPKISSPRTIFTDHLYTFGSPIKPINPSKTLRISMQNTQFSFQIYGDGLELHDIIQNLQQIDAHIFVPISPNINWNYQSDWV